MKLLSFALFALSLSSCMDQYNPRPYWEQFDRERTVAASKRRMLTAAGEVPPMEEAAAPTDPISAKFASLCSSCHGNDGKADSPAAGAMNPKPRNFHDAGWQAKVDDAHIAKVIKEGGASVGLSATMPAWGAQLNDEEIKGIVAKIREWGGKK